MRKVLKKSGQLGKTNWDAVIRVYDEAGNVIETHEHAGDFGQIRTPELHNSARVVQSLADGLIAQGLQKNATRVHGVTFDKEMQVTGRCRVRRALLNRNHNELI